MSSKFLTSSSSDLSNGTANLYIASLTIDNLEPSLPVKTTLAKTLTSNLIAINEVDGLQVELDSKMSNPTTETLEMKDNPISFTKQAGTTAADPGELKLYANTSGELHQIDEAGNDTVVGGDILLNLKSQSQGVTTMCGLLDLVASTFESETESTDHPIDQSATTASHGFTFTVPAETAIYAVGVNINHVPTAGVRAFRIWQDAGQVILVSENIGSADPTVGGRYKHTLASPLVLAPGTYSLAIELNTNDFINQTDRSSELSPLFTGYTGASALTPNTFPNIKAPANAPHVGYLYFAQPPNGIGTIHAQDAVFDMCEVNGTLTTDVLISRESVETKDTLMHLGVDNIADTSNLGTYWEYDSTGKKYGGLVRDNVTKKIIAFKDESTLPLPGSDMSTYAKADICAGDVEFNSVGVEGWTISEDVAGDFSLTKGENKLIFGDHASGIPSTLCIFDSRDLGNAGGFRTFKSRGTLASPTAVHDGYILDIRRSFPHDGTSYRDSASIRTVALGDHSVSNSGTYVEIELTPQNSKSRNNYYRFKTNQFEVGLAGVGYVLPTTRGTLNQVLKTNGAGVVSWQDDTHSFDQSLNTTDVVEFKGVDTRSTAETGGVILGQFDVASFWAHQDNIGGPILQLNKSRGTKTTPTAVLSGDRVGSIVNRGYNGSVYPEVAHTRIYATENFTGIQTGSRLEHSITRAGQTNTHPYFDLSSTGLKIGDIDGSVDYTLPVARGTLNQILKTDASGGVTWQSDNPFDQSLNTTDSVSFTSMTAGDADVNMDLNSSGVNVYKKYSNTINGPILETRRGRGTNAAKLPLLLNDTLAEYVMRGYNGSGEVVSSAIVSRATQNWAFGNTGSRMEIRITPTGTGLSVPFLDIKDDGLDIGNITAGTNYTLPVARGADGQILKTDGSGVVGWVENAPLESLSTGVLTGGILSVNVDTTKYDISDGTGDIVVGGVKTPISWSGLTAQSTTYVGILTYVSINSSGLPVYSATKPDNASIRDNIFLGVLVHVNGVNIDVVNNEQMVLQNTTNQLHDLANAIGFINTSGNVLAPSGANLTFQKSAGTMFSFGANYINDPKNPHNITTPLKDTAGAGTFQYRYQDGSSGPLTDTLIIPDEYDDGNGQATPGTIGGNNWQVQRVYLFTSNNIKIQPGQEEYKDYNQAIERYQAEAFVTEPSIAENGLLIGFLFVRGGATNLNLGADGVFLSAGKFGSSTSGGAGGSTKAYGQQYFEGNATETVVALTDTYYDMVGTRSSSQLNEVSAQALSLTYTGTTDRTLKLEANIGWKGPAGASAENYRIGFFKNGVLVVPGQMTGALQVGGNYPRNVSTSSIVDAVQNDVFTIKVKNVTATQNVVIKDFHFMISDI